MIFSFQGAGARGAAGRAAAAMSADCGERLVVALIKHAAVGAIGPGV